MLFSRMYITALFNEVMMMTNMCIVVIRVLYADACVSGLVLSCKTLVSLSCAGFVLIRRLHSCKCCLGSRGFCDAKESPSSGRRRVCLDS